MDIIKARLLYPSLLCLLRGSSLSEYVVSQKLNLKGQELFHGFCGMYSSKMEYSATLLIRPPKGQVLGFYLENLTNSNFYVTLVEIVSS